MTRDGIPSDGAKAEPARIHARGGSLRHPEGADKEDTYKISDGLVNSDGVTFGAYAMPGSCTVMYACQL